MRVKGGQAARRPRGEWSEAYGESHRVESISVPLAAYRSPLTRLMAGIRAVFGMPNYAAYRAHFATHHPGAEPLSERDFFADYLRTRYEGGPTRCC